MTTSSPPVVWVLFDEHDQEAQIAAALALRRAANDHRIRGQRREANELDELADKLERVVKHVHAAYRDAHPPGEKNDRPVPGDDGPDRDGSPTRTEQGTSSRPNVPNESPLRPDDSR